jgi:hypothetical protein
MSFSMWIDGQMDKHDEANSPFCKFVNGPKNEVTVDNRTCNLSSYLPALISMTEIIT